MLHTILQQTALTHAKKVALVCNNKHVTYSELYLHINHLSSGLHALGINQGDGVALVLPNCVEFVFSFFAIAQIHAIVLPLNPALKAYELRASLSTSQAKAIITDQVHAPLCRTVIASMNMCVSLILIDEKNSSEISFYDLLGSQEAQALAHSDVYAGDALSQFSSGSTGRPKRIVRTQQQLTYETRLFAENTGTLSSDAILSPVPLYHAHGLMHGLANAMYTGARLVLLDTTSQMPFAARLPHVFELIAREQITILLGTPHIFSALSEAQTTNKDNTASLRLCFSAGVPMPKSIFDTFLAVFGVPIRQSYGCTEAGTISTNMASNIEQTYNSLGIPIGQIHVRFVDEHFQDVQDGAIGEIAVKSPALTGGYCDLPDVNREAFKDGYFLTGDLGKRDRSGHTYLTGRKKLFIDAGGEKVDPVEVEDVLLSHPSIAEAVVVGCKSPFGGVIVKAVVVSTQAVTEREIMQYCQQRLADFKLPRIIEFRTEIPKTPLGKILRKDLLDSPTYLVEDDIPSFSSTSMSRKQCLAFLHQYLQQQVAVALQCNSVEIALDSSLGESGLTSASALALQHRLEDQLHIPISITLFWAYPTIIALAAYLTDSLVGSEITIPPEQEDFSRDQGRDVLLDTLVEVEQLSDREAKTFLETFLTEGSNQHD